MFLYWNNPSLAMWDFLRSTHSSKYLNMIGSNTLSLQLYAHFLFLNTSYRVSRARPGRPTSKNSEKHIKQTIRYGDGTIKSSSLPSSPLARFRAFSGLWLYLDMISVEARQMTRTRETCNETPKRTGEERRRKNVA